MTYRAPVKDMLFVMKELAGIDAVARLPGLRGRRLRHRRAVLEECARFNEEVVAPLNWDSDKNPSSFQDGEVTHRARLQGGLPPVRARAAGRACSTRPTSAARACPS